MQAETGQQPAQPAIAIFDFDGTLTYCDSLFPFLRSAVGRLQFWLGAIRLLPIVALFRLGRVSRDDAKEAALRTYLAGWSEARFRDAAHRFARMGLPRLLNPNAMARLAWHVNQGHRVMLASACLDAYVRPWAEQEAFETIFATRLETVDGVMTGRMDGGNCHGHAKLERVRAVEPQLQSAELHVYGDSAGDRELLAVATHPEFRPFRLPSFGRTRFLKLARALL